MVPHEVVTDWVYVGKQPGVEIARMGSYEEEDDEDEND